MTTASLIRLAGSDRLQGDGPHALSVEGVDLVVVRTPAGLRAFEGHCPHQGALLGEGEIEGGKLVCRNHRWRFSIDTGEREDGPQCLVSCPVVERDGTVFVDVSGLSPRPGRVAARRTWDDLPGPRGLPFLGNIHQLDLATMHLGLERWAARYGPVYACRLGPKRIVVLSDPKWIDQVLRARPETFRRDSSQAEVISEIGFAGVFSAEGDAWRAQRRLANSALAQRHLRGLYPKFRTVAARLKKRWERLADAGVSLDIVEELKRFTVDVTMLVTFGYDADTVEQEDDIIQRKLEIVLPEINRRIFALFPTWRLFRLPRDRRLDRALAELRAWFAELTIAERARLAAEPERAESPSSFLEAMLSARDDEGRPFPDSVIFGNLLTMLLAGEDTTAHTLGWAVHELCDSPESVTQLRQEADALLGDSDVAGDIDTANALAFAGAVANETMRLRPVAPIMLVEAIVETVVGDVLVPAGTRVCVLPRPAACDSRHFAEPGAFRPRRWLGKHAGAHDVSAHIPFGSGPRICPGRVFALLEMKLVLSMLYRNFDVERVGGREDVQETFAFTMFPAGLNVRLRRRAGASADMETT